MFPGYVRFCFLQRIRTYRCQDNPLQIWREERQLFLDELIRLEGRGIFTDGSCELCRENGLYRCLDCVAVQFLCGGCLNRVHSFHPFHVIQVSPLSPRSHFSTVLIYYHVEMEWSPFRAKLAPSSRLYFSTRASPCGYMHEPSAQCPEIYNRSHQRDSSRGSSVLRLLRGCLPRDSRSTTPATQVAPRNDT